MFFHVFYYFNAYCMGSGIGGFSDYQPQDAVLYLLYPWLMPLLFVVAGMSSRYALQSKSAGEYLRTRTRKLLVPATLGLFIFQWMAGYFDIVLYYRRFINKQIYSNIEQIFSSCRKCIKQYLSNI